MIKSTEHLFILIRKINSIEELNTASMSFLTTLFLTHTTSTESLPSSCCLVDKDIFVITNAEKEKKLIVCLNPLQEGGVKLCSRALLFTEAKVKFVALKTLGNEMKKPRREGEPQREIQERVERYVQRMVQEHALLSGLKHPNILKVKDEMYFIENNPLAPFTIEKLGRFDLYDFCAKFDGSQRSVNQLFLFFKDVINGLKYLRMQGIVHGDLKLGNVVICLKKGLLVAKIIDFDGHVILQERAALIAEERERLRKEYATFLEEEIYLSLLPDCKYGPEPRLEDYEAAALEKGLDLELPPIKKIREYLDVWYKILIRVIRVFGDIGSDTVMANIAPEVSGFRHVTLAADVFAFASMMVNVYLGFPKFKEMYSRDIRLQKFFFIGQRILKVPHFERPSLEAIERVLDDLLRNNKVVCNFKGK